MDTDFEYSHLTEDEIAAEVANRAKQASQEAEAERLRLAKARSFRFSGGVC